MTAKRRRRRKKRGTRLILCALVEIIVVLTLVAVIGWDRGVKDWLMEFQRPVVSNLDLTGIYSPNAVLIQARGGKVIGENNKDEKVYPASITKVMTAVVALEELKDVEKQITLTSEMFAGLYEQDATQAGFQPGETVRVLDLLYGVLLPSGAECCIALADETAGSEEAFVGLMNQKAEKLGMDHTNFCDSTGLHNPDHYSTVEDLAILLKYAIRNETIKEIMESSYHSTPPTNIHPDGITFYSTMFKELSSAEVANGKILGGKTGYTDDAGLCLASFAEIGDREYILVTAGARSDTGSPLHVQDAVTVYNRLGEALENK